jgi:GH24 family phage-related lysozyme (muramidase)
MARGTGLPLPRSGDVVSQPINIIDADRYSSARAWGAIAQAGAEIARSGDLALHQQRVGYTSTYQETDRRRRLELSDEHRDNPAGFDAAWKGYTDGALGETVPWAIDARRRSLGAEGNSAYAAILNNAAQRSERNAAEAVKTRITSASNDVIGAAMAGTLVPSGPTGEVQDPRILEYRKVLESAVGAQLHSQEWADAHMDDTMGKALGEAAARSALEIYRQPEGGGLAAASEHLRKNILENEELKLSLGGRRAAFARGMEALRRQQLEDKTDRAEIEKEARDLRTRINSNQPYEESEVRDLLGALSRTGGAGEYARLYKDHTVKTIAAPLKEGLPPAQGAALVAGVRTSARPGLSEAVKRFEGFTPSAQWDFKQYSSGYGTRAQPGETIDRATAEVRLNQELARAAEIVDRVNPNLPPGARDAMISLTFNAGADWVNAELGERIRAGDLEGAKQRFVQYNRAGGQVNETLVRRRAEEVQWFDRPEGAGVQGPSPLGPYAGEIAKRVQEEWVKGMKASWPRWKEAIAKGNVFNEDDFAAIRYAAALSNDATWRNEVDSLYLANKIGEAARTLPAAQRQRVLDEAQAQIVEGGWNVDGQAVLSSLQKQFERRDKLARENPVEYHIERGGAPPDVINFANPQQAAATVADRVAVARGVAASEQVPFGNPFRESERQSIAAAIASSDPQRSTAALSAMAAVPPEFAEATFGGRGNPIKDAISGAAVSSDPAKMTAANMMLDRYWRSNPNGFERVFDKTTLDNLQIWQGIKDAYSPAEVAERFAKARDPKEEAARKLVEPLAKKELGKIKVADVVDGFDSSWVPFTGPSVPTNFEARGVDGLQAERLMADFGDLYTEFRKSGVPADQAAARANERLATQWGASAVNGTTLMRLPPEKYYPTINGTHDWIIYQIDDLVSSVKGEKRGAPSAAEAVGAQRNFQFRGLVTERSWEFQTLVGDVQTEADIAQGRPPSYVIVIRNLGTGRDEVLVDANGNSRFSFDPRSDIAAVEAEARRRRAELLAALPRELAAEAGVRELFRLR